MQDLRISIIQTSLEWEQPKANLERFSQMLSGLEGHSDLIVLPEMFTTGFSMRPKLLAESMDGTTMTWLAEKAGQLDSVLTGSFIAEEQGQYYNRLIWMRPDGSFDTYDKRHLFTLGKEHEHYTAGQQRLITEWKGWKICPLICYDLRFPVWSRNNEEYDLLIYMANWPAPRNLHWKNLLMARAIENQVYTIGVNRIGYDAKDLYYTGDSSLINYTGEILFQVSKAEAVFTTSLSYQEQQNFRQKLQFLADQDDFTIINSLPKPL